MTKRHPQVINIDDVTPREEERGKFGFRARRLATETDVRGIGCSHYELGAGRTAFPYHFHSAIEESIYVLEGTGELRIGKETVEVRAGDFIAMPPGPEYAHALTAKTAMKYLCMSNVPVGATLDVVGYPDSKKVAFAAGIDPKKGPRAGAWLLKIIKEDTPTAGYYDDEPLAK